MPRSFRYDYFRVPPHDAHPWPKQEDRSAYAQTQKAGAGEAPLHYGKAHAETEEILARKREAHAHAEQGRPAAQGLGQEARVSAPIGAVPGVEEPPRVEGFDALWEDAQRSLRLLQQAVTEAGEALLRLARLPLAAARMTRQRLA